MTKELFKLTLLTNRNYEDEVFFVNEVEDEVIFNSGDVYERSVGYMKALADLGINFIYEEKTGYHREFTQ